MITVLKMDDSYTSKLNLSINCRDCNHPILFDTTKKCPPWYETDSFAVLPFYCPQCHCSGSIHLDLMLTGD